MLLLLVSVPPFSAHVLQVSVSLLGGHGAQSVLVGGRICDVGCAKAAWLGALNRKE